MTAAPTLIDTNALVLREAERVVEGKTDHEVLRWLPVARIFKYDAEAVSACRQAMRLDRDPVGMELIAFAAPDSVFVEAGNLLTNLGLKRIWNLFIATSTWVALTGNGSTGNGRIGVGDGTTAVAVTDTDLSGASGSTHRQFVKFDSTPSVATGVLTCTSTFTTALAQFHWQEWGIDGGTANGTTVTSDAVGTPGLLNHKLFASDPGTKGAASWVFAPTLTLA